MSNGPPTPPPSAQDVLDTDVSATVTATTAPVTAAVAPQQPPSTAYQMVFPDLASLAIQSKFQELASQAEIADLYVCISHLNHSYVDK